MPHERQIGSLITRAETQRLVADLYNQGMPIKEIARKFQFVWRQFTGG